MGQKLRVSDALGHQFDMLDVERPVGAAANEVFDLLVGEARQPRKTAIWSIHRRDYGLLSKITG